MKTASVEDLLREWIGLDAATIGSASVERAVRTRMAALGIEDPVEFASRVRDDAAERDRLVEEVIVAESWFFRDRQVFSFVADVAVTLAGLPGRTPVRILCVPCASGEEPYSVAMALLDAGLSPGQFTIDAVDVSRAALARAARGHYSANAFRNADTAFRDRWFHSVGTVAVLDERVRGCVQLAWGNLLDEGFVTGRGQYDIIFCRNLLIYLTDDARRRVERAVDSLLKPDGILILGAAEPPIMKGDWIQAGATSVFALRRGIHLPREAAPGPAATVRAKAALAPRPAATVGAHASISPPRPAAPEPPPSLADLLDRAGQLANAGRHLDALALCERWRTALPPAPELFFLMGVLHQAVGDGDRAEGCFHKTLYLDAGHEEALLALALLARQRGDIRMADTYRQSAARVLARKGTP